MIRKNHLLTAFALSIGLIALPLIHFSLEVAAVFSMFIGYFVAVTEFKKHTRSFQFVTLYFNTLVYGLVLDQLSNFVPYFTFMFLTITFVLTIRMHFHKFMLFTRGLWVEPLLMCGAVALYVIANLNSFAGWIGWAVPVAPLLYSGWDVIGKIVTGVQYSKAEKIPYIAEVGKPAPPFMLTDQEGTLININDYKGRKNMLLLFVRGDWCPTCHIMLRTYQRHYQRFRDKDIVVIAIGPDPMGVNREMVEKLGIEYKVLADEDHETAKTYGVQLQPNNPAISYAEGIPMPAAFLIDRNGIILYSSRHDKIGEILNPADIFPIVETLPQTI